MSSLVNAVMPVIRVMAQPLSWEQREACGLAIQVALSHWESMETEKLLFPQTNSVRSVLRGGSKKEE